VNEAPAECARFIERFGQKRTYLDVLSRIEVNGVALGKRVMADITGDDIEHAADQQQQRAAKGKHAGLSARRHVLADARYLWNWAIKKRILKETPFKVGDVAMIPVGSSRARDRRLVGDEQQRLLAAADPWMTDMIEAALETACRGGELRSLTWADIEDGWFVLRNHKTIKHTGRVRRVPISPKLQTILDRRRKGPDGNDLSADSYVFGDATGKQLKKRWFNRAWRALCDSAKITDLQFHDLRHETASQALEAGVPIHEVQALLGHTTLTMTQRYLNASEKGLKDSMKKLDAARLRKSMRVVS
jgi:integrase